MEVATPTAEVYSDIRVVHTINVCGGSSHTEPSTYERKGCAVKVYRLTEMVMCFGLHRPQPAYTAGYTWFIVAMILPILFSSAVGVTSQCFAGHIPRHGGATSRTYNGNTDGVYYTCVERLDIKVLAYNDAQLDALQCLPRMLASAAM